jgi:predicted transcriptional regulator
MYYEGFLVITMMQVNLYSLTELEQKILSAIKDAGVMSVKQVHEHLGNANFIGVMREVHKLHGKGYLTQTHVGSEARYKVKPRILTELQKTV